MTQATQTEAQRLAAALEKEYGSEVLDDAADKLRRLDAAEQAHMRELRAYRTTVENLHKKLDALLAHCPDGECATCSKIICPEGCELHFHHDGCPAC